jgi:hypothetical protein
VISGGAWSQSFGYTSAGRVASKYQFGGGFNLQANYTYNNEGQLVSTQYPNSARSAALVGQSRSA